MRTLFDDAVARLGRFFPAGLLAPLFRQALGSQQVALCLHRVGPRRPTNWQPNLTIESARLDELIDLLLRARGSSEHRWLTVSFDDGYADAVEYVETRAARFPTVEFLLFVCPEKVLLRSGFRWDLSEQRLQAGHPDPFETGPVDIDAENGREDLQRLTGEPEFSLADLDALKRVQALPNVRLGNHTDCHYAAVELTPEQFVQEFERSQERFEALFGPMEHFAFPFGGPEYHFEGKHVELLRRVGAFLMWSTEPRPYRRGGRHGGAVLPRFSPKGSWTSRGVAVWIAARALHARLLPPVGNYPLREPLPSRQAT